MSPLSPSLLAALLAGFSPGLHAQSAAPAAPPILATSLPPIPGLEGKALTPQQLDNVAALGQVWGFLKFTPASP